MAQSNGCCHSGMLVSSRLSIILVRVYLLCILLDRREYSVEAWTPPQTATGRRHQVWPAPAHGRRRITVLRSADNSSVTNAPSTIRTAKDQFLESLDEQDCLNDANQERTRLLNVMIQDKIEVPVDELIMQQQQQQTHSSPSTKPTQLYSVENPGLTKSMLPVAAGTWKVVYAPHMSAMMRLGGGVLDVQYVLRKDGSMESHAKCDFPWLLDANPLLLSVSGTFGSVSKTVCRVDFDHAWVRTNSDEPYPNVDDVPESLTKSFIDATGKLLFLEQFSVFPVSFLDSDLIVFDFELLGTRICARKVSA